MFTLGGLTLPDTATGRDGYSYEQRLSVALLYLVSQFARRLMNSVERTAEGMEPSEEHKALLRSLGNGECIFRDLYDRAGRIGVDLVSEELRD